MSITATPAVLAEVLQERADQEAKWGEQNLPNGTGRPVDRSMALFHRGECERAFANGAGTWRDILTEEYAEALAESDPERLREELLQVSAVAVAWVECIDRMRRGR